MWKRDTHLFAKTLPADETVAHEAVELRATTPHRLPTIDALIAATAVAHQLTLIHRDPHFTAIPPQLLK
ncbi:MAG: PIN domain-containing protein [Chloroflexi bacterium]|nr:PIN domain-containing protein [Chloroflexota bacterium]